MRRQQQHGNAPSPYRPVTPNHTRYCPVPVCAVAWQRPVMSPKPRTIQDLP
ncbi:hypothetical protein B989_00347 [Brucella sp. 56/94]|nr:hypothetical protein B989_00347 [Brucella sp. 56/94]